MLVIRNHQLRVLARTALAHTLLVHAREVAPGLCAGMSAEGLRSLVDRCLERCAHYGITRDYDVLRYLNLMLVFGLTFDTDQPWAAAPLAYPNPSARVEMLMDRALRLNAPPEEDEDEQ